MKTFFCAMAVSSMCLAATPTASAAPPADRAASSPRKSEADRDAKLRYEVSKARCGSMAGDEKKNCQERAHIDARAVYQEMAPASASSNRR